MTLPGLCRAKLVSVVCRTGMLVADGSGRWAKWSRGVVFFVHCLSLLQPDAEKQRLRHRYRGSECKNAIKECKIANDYFPHQSWTCKIHTYIKMGISCAINAHYFLALSRGYRYTNLTSIDRLKRPGSTTTSQPAQTHCPFP